MRRRIDGLPAWTGARNQTENVQIKKLKRESMNLLSHLTCCFNLLFCEWWCWWWQ